MSDKKKLTTKQQAKAVAAVAALSFRIAPGAVVFKLVGSVLDAVLPIVTTYFAALTTTALVAAYQGDTALGDQAVKYVIITATLGIITTIWRSIDGYITTKMRYLVEARVSDRMYAHFLTLDFWHYDNKDTADLYDRAQKFAQFFAWIFDRIAMLSSQLIGMVGAVVALAVFQPVLALFVFIAIIPSVIVQFKLSRRQIEHWNENIEVRRAQNMLEWTLGQPHLIAELRLYGMVNYMLGHRRHLRDTDEKGRIEFERRFMPLRIASDVLQAITELGSLLWVVAQIVSRSQPVGQFVYVQQIVSRALGSASSFVNTLGTIDEDVANLFDYQQFMQLESAQMSGKDLPGPPKNIEVSNVSFHYPGSNKNVLQDVSFTIGANQHVAIVGENGAGKSTLIKILTGLYRPTSGAIKLDEDDLGLINITSWHHMLGVLQQEFIHYNFANARDNVRFGDVEARSENARYTRAVEDAEAKNFIGKLPRGAKTYVNNWMEDGEGNKGVDLSGGQWQRLALARNFYRNAPIIILDEPTSAIDALAESRIFKKLFADKQRTVITISHRLSTVEKADVIYMLEDGKLVESGTHAELVKKKGSYYRLFESQIRE